MSGVHRATLAIAGVAGLLAIGTLVAVQPGLYAAISSLCMRLAAGVAQPGMLATLALGTIGMLTGISLAAAGGQVIRTRRAVEELIAARAETVPEKLRAVIARVGAPPDTIVVESRHLIAFCHGFIRPRLVFSMALIAALDQQELEAVVRHELAHAHRFDPLRNLLARSVSSAFFFFPLSGGLSRAYLCTREVSADRIAVSGMNGDVLPLASALQRVLEARGTFDSAALAIGALSATDVRIDHLLGVPTSPRSLIAPAGRLQAVAFVIGTVSAICIMLAWTHAVSGANPCIPC